MSRACSVAVLSAFCLSLAGCGGATAPPTAPTPEPSASPLAAKSHEILYVLCDQGVTAFRIDPKTGVLTKAFSQDLSLPVSKAHGIAGEPLGRYVYAGYGPRQPEEGGPDSSIVAYKPGPDGRLSAVSEASSRPIAGRSKTPGESGWLALRAGTNRVHGIWHSWAFQHDYYTYVTHAVGDDGVLGPAHSRQFPEHDPNFPTIDPNNGRVFRVNGDDRLIAYAVEPDGELHSTGITDLCGPTRVRVWGSLVTVGDLVLGNASPAATYAGTVCDWEGPRLAPRQNLGLPAASFAAAVVPKEPVVRLATDASGEHDPLVALESESDRADHVLLRLLRLPTTGDVELLDAVESPGQASEIVFHPSGQFLYRVECTNPSWCLETTLEVYAITPEGKLELAQTIPVGVPPDWYQAPQGAFFAMATLR